MSKRAAALFLFAASLIWGASFSIMKSTLAVIPMNYTLALRFGVGAVGLSYTLIRNRKSFTTKNIFRGFLVGLCLYGAFAVQSLGLMCIDAGKNALITAVYVVLVPFFMWAFTKRAPKIRAVIAATVCFAGVALLSIGTSSDNAEAVVIFGASFSGQAKEWLGVGLTAVSGVLYALHITIVSVFSEECDVMPLTFMQFLFGAAVAWAVGAFTEVAPVFSQFEISTWLSLGYLGFLSSLLALTFQNIGVKHADPAYASIILCTESLFGCIFGIVILHETMGVTVILGGILILASMLVSELRLKRKNDTNIL